MWPTSATVPSPTALRFELNWTGSYGWRTVGGGMRLAAVKRALAPSDVVCTTVIRKLHLSDLQELDV
jgi:hypothetical protein